MSNYYECSGKRAPTRNQRRRRKFIEQKLMGLAMIAITVGFLWMCAGTNEDAAAALLTGPLGLYMLFSRHIVIV